MNPEVFIQTVQVSWLVLCGMMLFSRFVFQAAGPEWMRTFLDGWKVSRTHQVWGLAAMVYGLALGIVGFRLSAQLRWIDIGVAGALVVVLCADGLLNLLPSWFGHFKERMQDAWVKRNRDPGRQSDKHLFGTVNLGLGAASLAAAAVVYAYRPLPVSLIGVAALIATLVMAALIAVARLEARKS